MAHLLPLILEFVQLFCRRFTLKWLVLEDCAYSNILYLKLTLKLKGNTAEK